MDNIFLAALLGLLEGLTEFIPVSSTGHLLLAGHFLGFDSPGNTFEVVIQLGAVLALISLYAVKLTGLALRARTDPAALRALMSLLIAFLPAVFIGLLAHDFIKTVLFESPMLIAVMLIVGGVILLVIDRIAPPPVHFDAMELPLRKALIVGFCQCLAMVPGVSRSGATIVGALMLGVEKRAAAEFSFLLSLPTMGAAVAYDLFKSRDLLDFSAVADIAVGFAVAFLTAIIVVRSVLGFIGKHGYAVFGWWRITVGTLALIGLWAGA
ncbi:undecaprenyl-diphosphate phosphatase [Pseudotabrizicola alkalilacus]|uniref:Undecaprenyl-diphosphatase n=1 Tax=Pseudotabrizicola alkalilacus TaxID=2305252 RepID=A0A411Z2V4_9RHOB|nr:undecaprenyl-diphosphate phosphatase [Pseudotabrizicola alkalilacus]RGP37370.1 undecaprenyl-diphosphate phosphatase [Pseudotabrizicola alkalilacus]